MDINNLLFYKSFITNVFEEDTKRKYFGILLKVKKISFYVYNLVSKNNFKTR